MGAVAARVQILFVIGLIAWCQKCGYVARKVEEQATD